MESVLIIGDESSNHIRIEVLQYLYQPDGDPYDSNWLSCKVSVSCGVWVGKKFLTSMQTSDFKDFFERLLSFNNTLKGEVAFDTMEQQISFKLIGNGLGTIEVVGNAISVHGLSCSLQFDFDIDQTYLPQILMQLKQITSKFPIR